MPGGNLRCFTIWTHKYYDGKNGSFKNGIPLNRDLKTLATHFNEAGYETGYIGNWHLGSSAPGPMREDERGGYQYWLASNCLEWTSDAYDTRLYSGSGEEVRLPGYRVDALTHKRVSPVILHVVILH